ncbi:MAG: hypothetical protein N2C12_00150, partial [Planctomycetales bacterium]
SVLDREDAHLIAEGLTLITEEMGCTGCHKFHDVDYDGGAPDLTGYMSPEWLLEFLRTPSADRFYGEDNDRMPQFAAHADLRMNQLDEKSLQLIVDWLRGKWYEGGARR